MAGEVPGQARGREGGAGIQRVFAQLFDANPLASLVLDAVSLQVLDANQAAADAFGYTREEFKALRTSDLTVPDDDAQAERLRQVRAQQAPTVRFGPLSYRRKDGSLFRAMGTSYVVDYGDRRIRVSMLEDVTETERLERQMQQAQRLESLGQLAGGVAHDFNNLLAVILNVTASLEAEVEAAIARGDDRWLDALRDLERVDKAGSAASRLTRQLLAFARHETLPRSVIDIGAQVNGLAELLHRTLGSHVRLVIEVGDDLWRVSMDGGHLEQVVINLAVNARDAMPQGGVLTISAQNVSIDAAQAAGRAGLLAGRYVQLQVSDSGTGMDKSTLERVFEPFFTTKPPGQGTGMGLATVYGIVKQVGGNISVYSEVGHGTTVTMLIPATEESVQEVKPSARVAPSGPADGTVLVVEDYDDLRDLIGEILRAAGYTVLLARDGAGALEVAGGNSGRIDLLLTDIVMPNMLGPDLARELTAAQPGLKVLFMSGHAQPMLNATSAITSDVALLQKPFMASELLEKVREVLVGPRRLSP